MVSVERFQGVMSADPSHAVVLPKAGVYLVVVQKDRVTIADIDEVKLGLDGDPVPTLAELEGVDPTGKILALVESL